MIFQETLIAILTNKTLHFFGQNFDKYNTYICGSNLVEEQLANK